MAGNSTSGYPFSCDYKHMSHCTTNCSTNLKHKFFDSMTTQLFRVDALLLVNAILAGVIVGIGAYVHRFRNYTYIRYLLLGANILFLPIISYVLSANASRNGRFVVGVDDDNALNGELIAKCKASFLHPYLVIVSTYLVLISALNTSPIVAADDREDRGRGPPFELLVQGIWIAYLAVNTGAVPVLTNLHYLRYTLFALFFVKMALKCYAFLKARQSFALGRNPCLIVGYMQRLRETSDGHGGVSEDDVPPPLIVMGEDERQVEKLPHGYVFSQKLEAVRDGDGLVTMDRVWQLVNSLPRPMPQLKDICLSFALFKMLRCRFARYKLTHVISTDTLNSVRSILLKDGDHGRAFGMIADELSFLHNYYASPLPVSYSDCWLVILSIAVSLMSIAYCILSGIDIMRMYRTSMRSQEFIVTCTYYCRQGWNSSDSRDIPFGSVYFDLFPVVLLLVFVLFAEARDIASHICSSWTKVTFICVSAYRASMQPSHVVPNWIGCLLRCKLTRHWNDKMRQSSVLVLRPGILQLVLPRCFLRFMDQRRKMNRVEVPAAVKACIMNALRSNCSNGGLSKGTASLRQSQDGESLLWACRNRKGTSDTMLIWHIATAILEVRHPPRQRGRCSSVSDNITAATHLSRYCAYLLESCPELLPDAVAWSKGLYKDVQKDAERALAGGIGVSTPETEYRQLIGKLESAELKHEVIKDAVKLAKQLVELTGGEEMAWELLAGFWSEMIIYAAPSDNIKGHAEAIDRGGELITLLWALLTHVGFEDRPDDTATAAAGAPVRV